MKSFYLTIILLFICASINAQYIDGNNVKFGYEWIDYSADYYKLNVNEDGIYRITKEELENMGFPVSSTSMSTFSMFNLGEEIEIYTSTEGIMSDGDFLEFYGKKLRNEIDEYLFDTKQHQLNTEFSLVTETNAYYLTYNTGNQLRYTASTTELSNSLPPIETYYIAEHETVYSNTFTKAFSADVRYSSAVITEGFGRGLRSTLTVNTTLPNISNNGPDPLCELRFGTNAVTHNIKVRINGTETNNYPGSGYQVFHDEYSFSKSLLQNSTQIKIDAEGASNDRFSLAYLRIKYPSTFEFNNQDNAHIKFDDNLFDRYIELQNFNSSAGTPVFYDVIGKQRINSLVEGGVVKFQFEGSIFNRDFYVVTNNSVKSILSAEKIEFLDIADDGSDYIILSHDTLFEDASTGNNYVQQYSDYRSSIEGGSYSPRIINVEDIYETFGYGIEGHHLGVKSFLVWASQNWNNMSYVFIIGKGREYAGYRSEAQKEADPFFYVPTFGFPGSDNLLVSDWGNTSPNVPIGRIAVRNTDQIRIYLDKVIEHEDQINNPQTIEDKHWMKKILHLSGGDPNIQGIIRNYLGNMEDEIETNEYGADVTTIYKVSSDPIENSQTENIRSSINNGASILTFFGHSAVGVFDLNLEDVNAYNNKGKYPLLISLGCHSGNVHTSALGMSEEFILAEDKGAIVFLAAASQAYIGQQYNFGLDLYSGLGENLFNSTLGDKMLPVLNKYESSVGYQFETLMQQITYHGDPAIKMHASQGSDYTPDFSSVIHAPEIINAFQDSFQVCFEVANLGIAVDSTLSVNIQHLNPANEIELDTSIVVDAPNFKENYCLNIPILSLNVIGKNTVKIFVDNIEEHDEWPNPFAENNNKLVNTSGGDTYEFFILNNGAVPVMPKNYSIYNNNDVALFASSFNALGDKQTYIFQIDTVESFDSPFMLEESILNASGLLKWEPNVQFDNNTVYYWRVAPEMDITGAGRTWNSSSFTYLPNSNNGWSQSHLNQFEDNNFDELELINGKLEYVKNLRDIRVINRVSKGENFANFFINDGFWGNAYYINVGPKLAVVRADSTGVFEQNDFAGKYGSEQPTGKNSLAFYFDPTEQESRISLVNFLEDEVEDSDYVFFYTIHKQNDISSDFMNFEWEADASMNNGRNIFTTLSTQGAVLVDSLKTKTLTPYNFFYQKNKEALAEDLGETIEDKADSRAPMFGQWFTGTETSVKIGPSTKWRNLVWSDQLSEVPANDSSYMRIIGVTPEGRDSLLVSKIEENEFNLSQISADEFPYLKLQYFTYDDVNLSSPDLGFWRVFFDGNAELALDPLDDEAIFKSDTLDEGNAFVLKIPLVNIGAVDVDSVDVKITLTDEENVSTVIQETLTNLGNGEKDYIEYTLTTIGLEGTYTVSIEANSRKNPMECFYFNNFGLRNFTIRKDVRNPLMDVSFDGRRILNGDIVSGEPIIRIVTKDENEFLLLNDTSDYQINLIDPDGISEIIEMDDPRITFTPAMDGENNESEIMLTPILEKDGMYTLEIRSKDVAGNISGNQDYIVDFEVINEELISNVFNYPNPFSDCTQFVFTLTGNEMPEDINIRIMTVSGKVVKEIGGLELGPLNIGVNRTEYKWDGTDEYGSKLANGVYLYQVTTTKQTGEFYEKYDTNTDKFFKNNIGKLVIIR